MGNVSEQILLKKWRNGDRNAMKGMYDLYSGYLAAVCSRYIRQQEDVKDVLQDSFIRIFSSLGSFEYRGEGSLKAWMTRIVVNTALRFIRDNSRNAFLIRQEELADGQLPDIPDEQLHLEDIPPEAIQKMIRRLPVGYRTVFNLFVFEDKSHKEIAEMLDIKENSSASQLHRAKALLAGWIAEYRSSDQ